MTCCGHSSHYIVDEPENDSLWVACAECECGFRVKPSPFDDVVSLVPPEAKQLLRDLLKEARR